MHWSSIFFINLWIFSRRKKMSEPAAIKDRIDRPTPAWMSCKDHCGGQWWWWWWWWSMMSCKDHWPLVMMTMVSVSFDGELSLWSYSGLWFLPGSFSWRRWVGRRRKVQRKEKVERSLACWSLWSLWSSSKVLIILIIIFITLVDPVRGGPALWPAPPAGPGKPEVLFLVFGVSFFHFCFFFRFVYVHIYTYMCTLARVI